MAIAAAAIVAAAIGAGVAINGASKKAKAKRAEKANKRPEYNINPEEQQNQNIAESLASQGLTDGTKQYYNQQSERGLTSTIDAVLKGGGDVNNINNSYGAYQDGISRLAVLDDQRHLANLGTLMTQNQRMSDQRDKRWQINEFAPYADKAAANAKQKQDGENEIWKGIGMVGSAVTTYAGGASNQKDIKGVNGGGSGGYAITGSGISGASSGSDGVSPGLTSGFNRYYNANTGQYMNTSNWGKLSPENQNMLNNFWNNSAKTAQ